MVQLEHRWVHIAHDVASNNVRTRSEGPAPISHFAEGPRRWRVRILSNGAKDASTRIPSAAACQPATWDVSWGATAPHCAEINAGLYSRASVWVGEVRIRTPIHDAAVEPRTYAVSTQIAEQPRCDARRADVDVLTRASAAAEEGAQRAVPEGDAARDGVPCVAEGKAPGARGARSLEEWALDEDRERGRVRAG